MYAIKTVALGALLLVLGLAEGRADYVVKVVDSQGRPVADALVSIPVSERELAEGLAIIDQVDKQFVPVVSSIDVGQAVSFPNSDNIRHHVYSFSEAKTFEIKLYSGTPTQPVVFDQPGIVVLGCNIHDGMVGYLYVSERHERIHRSDSQGEVRVMGKAPERVRVWHARLATGPHRRVELDLVVQGGRGEIQLDLAAPVVEQKRTFRSRFN